MEVLFVIIGLALVTTVLVLFVNESKVPGLGVVISVFVGALIFIQILPKISYVISIFEELASRASLNTFYLATIFKIIGISYIAEFGAQVCRDAGQGAIATKVEFAAKVLVMVLAVPIIAAIWNRWCDFYLVYLSRDGIFFKGGKNVKEIYFQLNITDNRVWRER